MGTKERTIRILTNSKGRILNHLREVIQNTTFNYRTFGTSIENHLADVIVAILRDAKIIRSNKDYTVAPHKNYFPDFELKISLPIAFEFKSGNRSQNRKGKWVKVKNSENDMGTLNDWPNRIKGFGGDNIFYIFVIYNFNNQTKQVLDIEIAPFYKFVGINKDGVLKYREKDGNLRPKDFDTASPIKTFKQFKELFSKTTIYRSRRIIKKHRLIIKKAGQNP